MSMHQAPHLHGGGALIHQLGGLAVDQQRRRLARSQRERRRFASEEALNELVQLGDDVTSGGARAQSAAPVLTAGPRADNRDDQLVGWV